jgi:hypothetical protein
MNRILPLLSCVPLALYCTTAAADVRLTEAFQVEAIGSVGMLTAAGEVTTVLADGKLRRDRQLTDSTISAQELRSNDHPVTIILLDQGLWQNLQPERREYSQLSFDALRQQLDYGTGTTGDELDGETLLDLPVTEAECRWSSPKSSVQHTGVTEEIAGVRAEQYRISVQQTCYAPVDSQACHLAWNLEQWTAKRIPGQKELVAFGERLTRAMGGEDLLSVARNQGAGLLGLFQLGWNRVLLEAGVLEGYPVRTVMSLEIGGERCTSAAGEPIVQSSDWSVMQDIAKETGRNTAQKTASNMAAQTAAQSIGGLGGAITGTAISEASRRVFDNLRKKKLEEEAARKQGPPAGDGEPSVLLFMITAEITSISKDKAADELFTIPAGWQQVQENP